MVPWTLKGSEDSNKHMHFTVFIETFLGVEVVFHAPFGFLALITSVESANHDMSSANEQMHHRPHLA
jgi:hypothetical protein